MPLNPTDAQFLGDLINDLNPYYDPNVVYPSGGIKGTGYGWQMDIDLGTPAPGPNVGVDSMGNADSPNTVGPNTVGADNAGGTDPNIMLEVDDHYYGEWNFNGQPQKISRALRIRYRYPVHTPSNQVYWVEDYLLIGYEGADGG